MSVKGVFAATSDSFTKSSSYINIKGDSPKSSDVICLVRLVFSKDQLNEDNWLYIGDATQDEKEAQLDVMKSYDCVIPILL